VCFIVNKTPFTTHDEHIFLGSKVTSLYAIDVEKGELVHSVDILNSSPTLEPPPIQSHSSLVFSNLIRSFDNAGSFVQFI